MVLELDTGLCASEEAEPRREVDTRWCVNKNVRPRRGWIGKSYIDWRRERVPKRTLNPEGKWIVRPHMVGEEDETFFIRVWKPLPNIYVLKTSRGSPREKVQTGQYLLAVNLGCYKWYQKQTPGNVPTGRLSPEGEWTWGGVPARTLSLKTGGLECPKLIGEGNECQRGRWPRRGWIVRPHINWGKERSILYKGVEISLKAQRGQYLLIVGLSYYM